MKVDNTALATLSEVEEALALGEPFGNSRYIEERLWLHYQHRLECLEKHVPTAAALRASLKGKDVAARHRVLGDPTVRSAIDRAVSYFKLGQGHVDQDEIQTILAVATDCVTHGGGLAPLNAGAQPLIRIGPEIFHGWVWRNERAHDASGRHFRRLFELHLGGAGLSLRNPDERVNRRLLDGARLLSQLLPDLARSALSHAHLIAIVDHPPGFTSVTNPQLMGSIFLAPRVLKTPWQAAEFLLHEAMHLKFIDLEHTHTMLRRGYRKADSATVQPLWNRPDPINPNGWPTNRVLTVAHVYTCLALFFTAVDSRAEELASVYGPLGELQPAAAARRAFDRAQYLVTKLLQDMRDLGDAGRSFIEWLRIILHAFDPCPPLENGYVHLLIDRYEREASDIKALSTASDRSAEWTIVLEAESLEDIRAMTLREVGCINQLNQHFRWAPSTLDGPSDTGSAEQSSKSPEDLVNQFLRTREGVCQALRNVPSTQFNTSIAEHGSGTVGESVLEMVDQSGQRFDALMRRIRQRTLRGTVQRSTVTMSTLVTPAQLERGMEYNRLGKTDLFVSAIGFGAFHLSVNNRPSTKEAVAVVHHALDRGITLIDTADVYRSDESDTNDNERLIFSALQNYSGATNHVIVATKGGMMRPKGAWARNGDPRHIRKAIRASFEALGGKRPIGLWQYHVPDPNFRIEESLRPVKEAQEEGLIQFVGVSNFTIEQIRRARDVIEIVSVQRQYSPWHRWPEYEGVLEFCEQEHLTFMAWGPFGGSARVARLANILPLAELAAQKAASVFCLVLAWLRSKSPCVVPIPGTRRAVNVQDSVRAIGIRLTPDETARIDQLFA